MVSGRKRTIYFMDPVVLDAKGEVRPIEKGFWSAFHEHVASLDSASRLKEVFGRVYEGEARTEATPAADYLYVGKRRPRSDWPHVTDAAGITGHLTDPNIAALVEYAYMLPVSGTNFVAILRSSGGASFSALEGWLTHVCPGLPPGGSLALRPYVRSDQLERLAAASGAAKVHLKVDAHSGDAASQAGELGQALADAQAIAGGGVTVEMTISFGRATPSEVGSENLAKQVQALLKSNTHLTKATATVMLPGEDGKYIRDHIDFARDRVTVTEAVGGSDDEEPTPTSALSAMTEAIRKFRKNLG